MSNWKKIIVSGSQAHLSSVTASNGSIISGSLTMSGSITNVDNIDFNMASSALNAAGRMVWDDGNGTVDLGLKGGNVNLLLGQQTYARVYNAEAITLNKGQVVYISGSQGNRVAAKLADYSGEQGSSTTIGFVAESIASGGEGFVITNGVLEKLNTVGLTEGSLLYLSSSGQYSETKPIAPQHTVTLGYVERVHATVGSIYVKIDNGYELDELHNVLATSATHGDLLMYSASLWKNSKQLSGSYGLTGSLQATSFTGSLKDFEYDVNSNYLGGIGIGGYNNNNYNYGIGIGETAYNNYVIGIGIGNESYNNFESGIGIGTYTYDNSDYGIGIGNNARQNSGSGIGIGRGSYLNYKSGIGLGHNSRENYDYGIGIGYGAYQNYTSGIGIGYGAVLNNQYGIGIGYQSANNFSNGVGIGYASSNNYTNGVGIGYYATSNTKGNGTVAIGSYSKAERQNEFVTTATANTTNKAQSIIQKFRQKGLISLGSIFQELFTDGASSRVTILASSLYQFRFQINAIDISTFVCKTWEVVGAIKRDASNNTSIVGTPIYTVTSEEISSKNWDVLIDADDTNETLRLRVKHDSPNTVTFSATIWATETRI